MARDKLKAALANKGPDALRQAAAGRVAVTPVDIIAAAAAPPTPTTEEFEREKDEKNRTDKPIEKESVKKEDIKPKRKTEEKKSSIKEKRKNSGKKSSAKPRLHSERDIQAILAPDKRVTERYSFEIYSDQKQDIAQLCERYENQTGQKLSASRFLRELIDYFLPGALKAFEDTE